MQDFDVIIAGAGPAGLWAGYELSMLKRKVLVIERSLNMDNLRRACSMQLILDDDYEGEGVSVCEGGFFFPKSNFHVPYHGKLIPVFNKYYHSPKNHVMRFTNDDGSPFSYKFDKQVLLKEIYSLCVANGVEFAFQATVCNASDEDGFVKVFAKVAEKEKIYTCRKFINAEGVSANICEKMGINKNRLHVATALCLKTVVKGISSAFKNSWNLYYGRAYHSNAAVIVGQSLFDDCVEITISGDKNNKPVKIYENVLNDSPLSGILKQGTVIDRFACAVKAYMPLKDPCIKNTIVIGDAAAFVEVETQGAFLCGHHAAAAVNKELDGEDGFSTYRSWWQKSFEFNGDDYMRVAQGYALVPTYNDDELDYLFALAENEKMQGTYSQYKTPKLIWNGIRKHTEKIKKEMPVIYEKMQKMNLVSLKDSFEM